MTRLLRLLYLLLIAAAVAACSVGTLEETTASPSAATPPPSPQPIPSLSPAASPTPSPVDTPSPAEPTPDPATVVAANGIGPYVVGASLSDLQSRSLVTNVEKSVVCDDSWRYAEATGRYADDLSMTFQMGRLVDVHTGKTELVTPSGARVGMSLTELQRIYGTQGTLITGTNGNQAFSVRVPDTDLGIVFYLDETNTTARAMSAGEVERLEQAAIVGEGC
jgi:hypothetical protein